jgi:2-alkyl-3-oxoalkanoate reductase
VNAILAAAGLPPVTKSIPHGVARFLGGGLELIHGAFGIESEPRMTRFLADELATAPWVEISAARPDIG